MNLSDHPTELLPWLSPQYEQLVAFSNTSKLAHAYLFGGQQGLGKLMLARHFAHYLLCTDRQGNQPCDHCRECQLIAAETHPDLKIIQPEDSSAIRIEQVRETIEFVSHTSRRGGYKVVIICPAEAMNTNSANALLKVLEEPSANTLLILVSHQTAFLMATIRSRCHSMKFNRPSVDVVIPWLESKNIRASAVELLRMANQIPLRALHFADDDAVHDRVLLHGILEKLIQGELGIAQAAAECEKFSLEENIEGMMLCASDILAGRQVATNADASPALDDHDLVPLAAFFSDRTKLKGLHDFYRELLSARRAAKSTSNPNPTLVLESLFFNWAALGRT